MLIPRAMVPRSVTARLVASYCLLLMALGGAFLGVTVLSFRYFTRQTLIENLAARDREIWNLAREALTDPPRLTDVIERRFQPEVHNRFIRVRIDEKVIYQSGDPRSGAFRASQVPWLNPAAGPHAMLAGNLLLYARTYFVPGLGAVSVATGQSYATARAVERHLFASLLVGLPILLLLAALAGYALMRRALMPVETMIEATETYSFDDPHRRLPMTGTEPRIAALGLALNRMLDRLGGAYSHVSHFSADAAHALRAPLIRIRGELELIAAGRMAPEAATQTLTGALEEMNRLDTTLDSLIVLCRLEESRLEGRARHDVFDLAALVDRALAVSARDAARKNVELARVQGAPLMVMGDGGQLGLMLARLLDNAVQFTPAGGQVTVETGEENGMAFVAVEDTGIGIDPSHHARVFERFYRIAPAPGDKSPGLGLAIVRAVALAHGGRAWVRSVPGLGSIFRVDLPMMGGEGIGGERGGEVHAPVNTQPGPYG
jgi:two-component system OmpR family sensor kinase